MRPVRAHACFAKAQNPPRRFRTAQTSGGNRRPFCVGSRIKIQSVKGSPRMPIASDKGDTPLFPAVCSAARHGCTSEGRRALPVRVRAFRRGEAHDACDALYLPIRMMHTQEDFRKIGFILDRQASRYIDFVRFGDAAKADFALPLQIKQAGGQKELTARLYDLQRRLRAARPAVCPLQSASP